MNIIKDDSFGQSKYSKEFYDAFCQRAEKYSGGIQIFDAAEQFYQNNFGLINKHGVNFLPVADITIKNVFKGIILINERGTFYIF